MLYEYVCIVSKRSLNIYFVVVRAFEREAETPNTRDLANIWNIVVLFQQNLQSVLVCIFAFH